MAEPVPFNGANMTLKGNGVLDLPVMRAEGQFISKWVFTEPELQRIMQSGYVTVHVLGDVHPPIAVAAPAEVR